MKRNKRGFVMVCVLWVLAILTILTVGFGRRAMLDRRAAAYSVDVAQARMMARAATERGIVELRNKAFTDALRPKEGNITYLGQPWAQRKSLLEEGKYFEKNKEFDEDDIWFTIQDEERYININTAPKEVLEEVKALERGVMRRILKRRMEAVHKDEGISPFQAPEEIRYLRGVDEKDWFGTKRITGLKYLLTTNGDGRINVNTASREVLESIPKLGERAAGAIIQYRAGSDNELNTADDRGFTSLEDLADRTGISGDAYEAIQTYCKFTSNCFRITGIATRRGGGVRAKSVAVVYVEGMDANLISWQEDSIGS